MDDEEDSKRSQIFGEDEAAAASEPEPKRSRRMDDDEDEDYEPLPKAPPLLDRETLLEAARNTDFFEWLERFSQFSLPTLLAILGAQVPPELIAAGAPPDILLPALKSLLDRALAKRPKRPDINSIEDVLKLLQTTKNILVLTGAGVSVSCGIPDFRSANGIYSRLAEFQLDDPQQMFDIDYFKFQPKTFYTFAKEIYPSNFVPSPSHHFIKLLESKGKLLRNYTQNIDTLEQKAGIERIIQCHGSFAKAKCIVCGYTTSCKDIEPDIMAQSVPVCPVCPEEADGILKPSITFFGEKLPEEFDTAFAEDRDKVDLLIVMGSSLKVSPVADVKDKIPHDVPQILINMEALPHMSGFDVQLLGYCDSVVTELCRLLDWNLEHPKIPGSSSLAAPQESEDAQGTVSRPPVYRPGSLPHRYLFEGGLERPVFDSDVSSVCSSSDGSSSDDGRDSCLDDEEDEDEQQSVVQEDSLDVQSKTEGSSREDDGHRKGYDADQEDLNPEATLSATSAAESPSLTSIDGESSMVEDPSLDQEAPGSLVQSE